MKYKKEHTELDTWKPLADIFSGLMLMFLLILMLIILFIGYRDNIYDQYDDGDDGGDHAELVEEDDDDGGGGGGGHEVEEPEDVVPGEDGLAAIKVVVYDEDTGKVIKHEGMEFELLSGYRGEKLTLYTYYPQKTPYTLFETLADGTFFLPEKIQQNTYVLKNLSAPPGYISGETMAFSVPGAYFWDEPLVVRFPLSMRKHSFDIHVTDSRTGDPVPNGVYNITNAAGKVVGEITCDANGYGHSGLLPVNTSYSITQTKPNEFYAALETPVSVALREDVDHVVEVEAVKTTYRITLSDELKQTPIKGAKLAVYGQNNAMLGEYTTADDGSVELQNLQAGASYTVVQTAWADNWLQQPYKTRFTVDTKGRISGYATYSVSGTNRMIRVNLAAKGLFFNLDVRGKSMVLRNETGGIVKRWNSEKNGTLIEGLTPGRYTLEVEGKTPMEITVENAPEIQSFAYRIINPWLLGLAILLGVGVVAGAAIAIVRFMKKKKTVEKEENADEPESAG